MRTSCSSSCSSTRDIACRGHARARGLDGRPKIIGKAQPRVQNDRHGVQHVVCHSARQAERIGERFGGLIGGDAPGNAINKRTEFGGVRRQDLFDRVRSFQRLRHALS